MQKQIEKLETQVQHFIDLEEELRDRIQELLDDREELEDNVNDLEETIDELKEDIHEREEEIEKLSQGPKVTDIVDWFSSAHTFNYNKRLVLEQFKHLL